MRLHVLAYGAEKARPGVRHPVALLHGGMAHARWWDLVGPRLSALGEVFAIDRRGHGDSDWADAARYGWERDLLDAETVLSLLSRNAWIVIGHSQGGLQAVYLAARQRVPIAALVLVDVPFHPASPRLMRAGSTFVKIRQPRFSKLETAIESFRPFPGGDRLPEAVRRYVGEHSFKRTEDGFYTSKFHWQVFKGPRREGGTHTGVSHAPAPLEQNPLSRFESAVAELEVPLLWLRGAESTILTADDLAELGALVPNGRTVEVSGATHNPHLENPAAVADAIHDFLAAI